MPQSKWFNARILCLEEEPRLCRRLSALRARPSWAPLRSPTEARAVKDEVRLRVLPANWQEPNHPYHLIEGQEAVLLDWPGPQFAWLLPALQSLFEAARRSRVHFLALRSSSHELHLEHLQRCLQENAQLRSFVHVGGTADDFLRGVEAAFALA